MIQTSGSSIVFPSYGLDRGTAVFPTTFRGKQRTQHVTHRTGRQLRRETAEAGSREMAAAAVAEFQRARSLIGTDRNASIDILHSIGKWIRHSQLVGIH